MCETEHDQQGYPAAISYLQDHICRNDAYRNAAEIYRKSTTGCSYDLAPWMAIQSLSPPVCTAAARCLHMSLSSHRLFARTAGTAHLSLSAAITKPLPWLPQQLAPTITGITQRARFILHALLLRRRRLTTLAFKPDDQKQQGEPERPKVTLPHPPAASAHTQRGCIHAPPFQLL